MIYTEDGRLISYVDEAQFKKIPEEEIESFLFGRDSFEHIVNIECGYGDEYVSIIYKKGDKKFIKKDEFKPFVWAKRSACIKMFDGDRKKLKSAMNQFGIGVKKLITKMNKDDVIDDRIEDGYKYIFYATKKMPYNDFMRFFTIAKTPIYGKENEKIGTISTAQKEFLAISPVEQYMIQTGRRLFKGYENYDELKRLSFDLETEGLNPKVHAIDQIGIRTNKGFEKLITITGATKEEKKWNEYLAIREFLSIILEESPDVIIGYNSENFDWDFLIVRLDVLGFQSMQDLSLELGFNYPIYKKEKETVLKLGGEVEYYRPTIIWGRSVIDALHAVRRAQAIDSNMKSANLKYVTKYSSLNKRNRVYVPGDKISQIWNITNDEYAFNDENGDWYHIDENHQLKEGYIKVSGKYIVERYLLDDIWETDKVELRYNESNFLLCKLLPTTFQRACTMGTAGTWKLIMLAWCYENSLAVPAFGINRRFTGGLSRLLKVGYVDNIVKLDYNSLYPSIMLSWHIENKMDISGAMLSFLGFILSQREKFKALKKKAGKEVKRIKAILANTDENTPKEQIIELQNQLQHFESEENSYDKKQLPYKIFGNSMFGSYGSPNVYPWGYLVGAESITCIGRSCLRLMISWFTNLGYVPVVGDSFIGDTPLFIKYNETRYIDIKPISELINENKINIDLLGREYDYSKKPYKVLCRTGWVEPSYIYRHKTDKDIYEVKNENGLINVTEDHSLFNEDKVKIKPSEINENTKLEMFNINEILNNEENVIENDNEYIKKIVNLSANCNLNKLPINILNGKKEDIQLFLDLFYNKIMEKNIELNLNNFSKTFLAGINYLNNKIK